MEAGTGKPRRSYRGLAGLLTAEAVSLSGTRLSMIAIPWFVISSTGSPLLTGLVAFAETAPYVVAKALGGPLIDRFGARRVAITADAASMAAVAAIPLLHAVDLLPIGMLLALVAMLGLWRGPADAAKKTLIPEVVGQARIPMERATGLSGTVERLATTVGAAAAGAVVASVGPLAALVLNAATFATAPTIIHLTVRVSPRAAGAAASDGGYFAQLVAGFRFLASERLLRSLAGMIAVTNLLEAAMASVLLPVWAHATGHGPAAIGLLAGASAAAAIGSSLLAAVLANRLPRRATFLAGFLVVGGPRFVVLALDLPLWLALGVWVLGGVGQGFLNPIIWAVIFERVPQILLGRVQSLITALAWVGIPLGPPVAGALVVVAGLSPVLVVSGLIFLVVTTLPGLQREWAEMNRTPRDEARQGTGYGTPVARTVIRRTSLLRRGRLPGPGDRSTRLP